MPKSPKDIVGDIRNIFSGRKRPEGAIKGAGAVISPAKESTLATPAPNRRVEIPFSGQYDVTVVISPPEFETLPPVFVPLSPVRSKVSLNGNGHPLLLPLGQLHPGWVGSVPLEVGLTFADASGPPEFAPSAVSWWDKPTFSISANWRGTCAPDGSSFSLEFDYVGIPLKGTITGTRSSVS